MKAFTLTMLAALMATACAPVQNAVTPEPVAPAAPEDLVLWYDHPAADWETEGLPVGNGAMGIMVTGGIATEILQFNEKTLWTGGPGSSENGADPVANPYNYGRPRTSLAAELAAVQADLAEQGSMAPDAVAARLGQEQIGYGHYQSFGELVITHHGDDMVTDYRRALDIGDGTASVTYRKDGVTYRRDYFASYPDGVIVMRISADEPGAVSLSADLTTHDNRTITFDAAEDRLVASGHLLDNDLAWATEIGIRTDGGRYSVADGTVTVEAADAAWFVIAAGTDYAPVYPHYRGDAPAPKVHAAVSAALARDYDALLATHQADFSALFDRVSLDLGQQMPDRPTDELLGAYRDLDPAARHALDALYFQYGRYLLVSSSRPGSLPANLQGVWNNSMFPPWNADYHVNINLQMNYWPAEITNLSETALPLFDFTESLVPSGEISAREIAGADGWMVSLNANIYGFTGLIAWPTAFWQPEGAAWLAQHFWEHYEFTQDEAFLRERAFPVMKGAAEFWLDLLVEDPRDGTLVVSPSYSPEQGDFTMGAAMSQQIVYDLFTNILEAGATVDDPEFIAEVTAARDRLDPGLRIGAWGQLQEWKQDLDDPDNDHRHVSHLFALHPGDAITPDGTPALAEAARVTLDGRGDGGTGWSKAWKINFWARLGDGDRAYKLLGEQLVHSTMPNLLDTHPPFQIDGNFGATSGITEMLLQSQNGVIRLLPALPSAWPDGQVTGLKARGNVTVDIAWQEGQLASARLVAGPGGDMVLAIDPACIKPVIAGAESFRIPVNGRVEVEAEPGATVSLRCP